MLTLVILSGNIGSALNLKVKKGDTITSGSDTQSSATTHKGDAASLSTAGSNSNQNVVLANGVNSDPTSQVQSPTQVSSSPDKVIAASNSGSTANTYQGNAVGVAAADSSAKRKEYSNTPTFKNDTVLAASTANSNASTQIGNALAVAQTTANSSNLHYDLNGNLVTNPIVTTPVNSVWYDTKKQGKDLSIGAEGDMYVVGEDSRLYIYNQPDNRLVPVEGDVDLVGIVEVATNYEGTPYVVTMSGETYFLSCENKWTRLPGCAKHIATGRGGEIFKISCEESTGGYMIQRLFCKCACKCCSRGCKRYRQQGKICNPKDEETPSCYWFRNEGAGVQIAVSNNGWPYIINSFGNIFGYDGSTWSQIGTQKAIDLSFSNDGVLYVTGTDNVLYKVTDEKNGVFKAINTDGLKVVDSSVGPFGLPAIISKDGYIYVSSKRAFN